MKNRICNPYLPPYEYVPDGEPYVFGDRLYVYGSHDMANCATFCAGDYVVWSVPLEDLSDWKCEGVSFRRTDDPHNRENKYSLFAPDVVKGKDGKYYLYYCLSFLEEFGVARSDKPEGPFQFYGHVKKADGTIFKEDFPYDPSVLLDDDGRVYLYYGFSAHFESPSFKNIIPSPGCMVVELSDDMLTIKGRPRMCIPSNNCCKGTTFVPKHAYFEAPSIRKIGKTYYLVYSSQSQHELCYATSKSPIEGFVYGGVIISNGDIGCQGNKKAVNYTGTNHGGMVKIGKEWYIFYHRNSHGLVCCRQGCAEKIEIAEDGSIAQVPVSSVGLLAEPFPARGEYPAYIACYLERIDTQIHMKSGKDFKETEPYYFEEKIGDAYEHYIANITDRTRWGYKEFLFEGKTRIELKVRGNAEGKILISTDREARDVLACLDMRIDEGRWRSVGVGLGERKGIHSLYFTFEGQGNFQFLGMEFL